MNYAEHKGFLGEDPVVIREFMRDASGRQKTASLFEESIQPPTRENGYEPLYSLRDYDYNGKPSAYQIYIHSADESEAALKLVGSYQHWRKLCSLDWFINGVVEWGFEGLARWRKDMSERDSTTAKKALLLLVQEGNVTAARALHKMAEEDLKRAKVILHKDRNKKEQHPADVKVLEFLNKNHKEV